MCRADKLLNNRVYMKVQKYIGSSWLICILVFFYFHKNNETVFKEKVEQILDENFYQWKEKEGRKKKRSVHKIHTDHGVSNDNKKHIAA